MTFSSQDLFNAGIPLDVKIETLYKEIKNGGLTLLPRRTMIRTIRNKYSSIQTLNDLFNSSVNTKGFDELRRGIITMAPTICAVQNAWTSIVTIPANPFTSFEEGLRLFILDYIMAKRQYATLTNHQVNAAKAYCTTLKILFDENSEDNSREKAADVLGLTRQNIDDKVKQAQEEFHGLFFEDKTPDNIAVDPRLVQFVRSFSKDFSIPGTRENMMNLSGIRSPRMLDLLALILGCTILTEGLVNQSNNGGAGITRYSSNVKTLLKKEGIPISFDDFRILLALQFRNPKLRDGLEQFARGNHELEIKKDPSGKELIAVKWEYLHDLDTELLRILYDNDAWGPRNAMSGDALRAEWERRARLSGRKDIQYTPKYRHWRFCPTKTGHVMLRWSKADVFLDGQKYISSLVFSNPGWTLNDVLNQARKDGYTNIYERNTLQTYYSNAQDNHTTEDALVASVRILDYENNQMLSFQDLFAKVSEKGIPIQNGVLRKWIIRNDKTFSYISTSGKKACFVKLINKKAALITPNSVRSSPASKSVTTTIAPSSLKPAGTKPVIDISAVCKAILSFVPETKFYPSITSVDKVLSIMKGGAATLPHNSVFYGWLPQLCAYGTLTSWAKDGFRKNLLLSVEAYVTNFYQLKMHGDLKTDIMYDPAFSSVKAIGLGTMTAYLSSLNILPDRKGFFRTGTLDYVVNNVSKEVVDARNNVLGHAGAIVNLSDTDMNKQVHDTLLLFLYLGSKL